MDGNNLTRRWLVQAHEWHRRSWIVHSERLCHHRGWMQVYDAVTTEPDTAAARRDAAGIQRAMAELRKVAPDVAAYVSESNFFEAEWQRAFWGSNYPRLRDVKSRYDPQGLLWSADGFTPLG